MIMKKLFLSLGLALGTLLNANATQLVIVNNCHTYVCIQSIQTSTINGINYAYVNDSPINSCEFIIDSGDTYHISDGDTSNHQFPFLNIWPFAGNVYQGPGSIPLPLAILPLPPAGTASPNRYQFNYIKFIIKGANGNGFGENNNSGTDNSTLTPPGTYYSPAGEPYYATYMKLSDIHYFEFSDNL